MNVKFKLGWRCLKFMYNIQTLYYFFIAYFYVMTILLYIHSTFFYNCMVTVQVYTYMYNEIGILLDYNIVDGFFKK